MPPTQLTITLAPDGYISVETLRDFLERALEMLRGLEADFVSSGTTVRWEVVKVRMRSPLRLTIAPHIEGVSKARSIGSKIVKTAVKGMEGIERGATAPAHFNDSALRAARAMLGVVRKEGAAMTFGTSRTNQVAITENAARHIDEIVAKARTYVDVGTIEGRLETISVHGTPQAKPQIRIWDPLPIPGRAVRCVITEERLPQAKDLLGQRVAVTGPIHYRDHVPHLIEVEDMRRLRTQAELPQIENMEPIDITGELSSEEYIRRMRDAE